MAMNVSNPIAFQLIEDLGNKAEDSKIMNCAKLFVALYIQFCIQ